MLIQDLSVVAVVVGVVVGVVVAVVVTVDIDCASIAVLWIDLFPVQQRTIVLILSSGCRGFIVDRWKLLLLICLLL